MNAMQTDVENNISANVAKLTITEIVSGKFGEYIRGTFDGVSFTAKTAVCPDGQNFCWEIESDYKKKEVVYRTLRHLGYIEI